MSKAEIIEILAWEHGRSETDPGIMAFAELLEQSQNVQCSFVEFQNLCHRAAHIGVAQKLINQQHEIFDFFKN